MTQNTIEVVTAGPRTLEINSGVSATGATVVTGNTKRYRREFNDPTLAEWDVSTGTGMTATVSNGNLVVTGGTTANQTTTFTTKESFTAPFKSAFGFKISSKIANQEYYLEVVAENTNGVGLDETVCAAWRIAGSDSTTVTIARAEVRNGGAARLQSANISSQASQTTDTIYEITLESDEIWFTSKLADSAAGRYTPYVRNTTAPDPNRRYRLRIRVVNGATAPASNVTSTFSFVSCVDYTEFQMEVTGGTGGNAAGQAIPTYLTGSVTQAVSGTVSATTLPSATATGLTAAKVLSAATTNSTIVKASAGRVYGYSLSNTSASWRYVKFYNLATAPVVGTTVPLFQIAIPPNGNVDAHMPHPLAFATGIGYAITAGAADLDATAIGASEVLGGVWFI